MKNYYVLLMLCCASLLWSADIPDYEKAERISDLDILVPTEGHSPFAAERKKLFAEYEEVKNRFVQDFYGKSYNQIPKYRRKEMQQATDKYINAMKRLKEKAAKHSAISYDEPS